jgi:hypothetical protein
LKDSRFQVQFIPPRNDGQGVLLIQALIDWQPRDQTQIWGFERIGFTRSESTETRMEGHESDSNSANSVKWVTENRVCSERKYLDPW